MRLGDIVSVDDFDDVAVLRSAALNDGKQKSNLEIQFAMFLRIHKAIGNGVECAGKWDGVAVSGGAVPSMC